MWKCGVRPFRPCHIRAGELLLLLPLHIYHRGDVTSVTLSSCGENGCNVVRFMAMHLSLNFNMKISALNLQLYYYSLWNSRKLVMQSLSPSVPQSLPSCSPRPRAPPSAPLYFLRLPVRVRVRLTEPTPSLQSVYTTAPAPRTAYFLRMGTCEL